MPDQKSARPPASRRMVAFLFRRRPFEHETSVYLLLSVLDFYMTWWLLSHRQDGHGGFVESNPVARFFLEHWGVRGLFSFKIAAVLLVVVLTVVIAERRPEAARAVLWIGIAVTGIVLAYGVAIYARQMQWV